MTEYHIQAGDTLYAIANAHNIPLQALLDANPGINPNTLQIGQVINLPQPPTHHRPPPNHIKGYIQYSGPASAYPDPSQWADWEALWRENTRLFKYHDTDAEIEMIRASIERVADESGVDRRVILYIIAQESGGKPRVKTSNNGVRNPGLMQSHNGVEFDSKDPAGSILQMIRDGTSGTRHGDGLKQLLANYGNYYETFRGYNSGSVDKRDLNDPKGATGPYVRDVANRLMGHVWDGM